jgi:hypothetical protein
MKSIIVFNSKDAYFSIGPFPNEIHAALYREIHCPHWKLEDYFICPLNDVKELDKFIDEHKIGCPHTHIRKS